MVVGGDVSGGGGVADTRALETEKWEVGESQCGSESLRWVGGEGGATGDRDRKDGGE